jgi:hypothetical protein
MTRQTRHPHDTATRDPTLDFLRVLWRIEHALQRKLVAGRTRARYAEDLGV